MKKENKDKRVSTNFKVIGNIILIVAFFILLLFTSYVVIHLQRPLFTSSNPEITVPAISGVYRPLDNSNYIVVVLDKRNQLHNQLVGEIENALGQINQLNQGGK